MRAFLGFVLLATLALPSCDKLKDLSRKGSKSSSSGPAASIMEIDALSYESFTRTTGRLAVVEFGAGWCPACKEMEPVMEKMAGEFPDQALVAKIDVDTSKAFSKSENVSLIPEIRFFRDGKQVERLLGAVDEAKLRALFRKHTAGLEAATNGGAAPAEPPIRPMKKDWHPPGIEKR